MFENQKKKYGNKKLHKSPSNRSFRHRFSQLAMSSWCQKKRLHHSPHIA